MERIISILGRPLIGRLIIAAAAAAGGALLTYDAAIFAAFCSQ